MRSYVAHLDCLNCSQSRGFVLHGDREQRLLGQAEAASLVKKHLLTCARCGSSRLIRSWTDAMPYATASKIRRRRRAGAAHSV